MPFQIIRNDITKVEVDAVVNAANPRLKMGAGVCGAIFKAAGEHELQNACDAIGHCDEGNAVITDGFKLPAKYIIHTVGPVWKDGNHNEEAVLRKAYSSSFDLAVENKFGSIAFPLISSGHFMYPKKEAFQVAISAISDFLDEHDMMVYLVVYDNDSYEVSKKRLYDVKKFIDDNYVEEKLLRYSKYGQSEKSWVNMERLRIDEVREFAKKSISETDEFKPHLEEKFSRMLLRLIDERGMTDPQVYNRAFMTRQHFSKIRNNKNYQPGKPTALALSIALMLNLDDTIEFLRTAGLTLSKSLLSDVIIEYHIRKGIYDIFQINEMLLAFDQEPLGA